MQSPPSGTVCRSTLNSLTWSELVTCVVLWSNTTGRCEVIANASYIHDIDDKPSQEKQIIIMSEEKQSFWEVENLLTVK